MRKKALLVLSITIISAVVIALFTYWQWHNDKDDPVVAAQKHLKWIADNPTKWGQISPEATELIQQLTPTRRGAGEEILDTIDELVKLRDPRSPSIFVDYYYAGVWGEAIEQALIEIGPPSVPALLPLLDDSGLLGRARAAKVLGVIATEYRQDLGGIVEFILLPKLEKLAISDPDPIVRQYSSDAVTQIR